MNKPIIAALAAMARDRRQARCGLLALARSPDPDIQRLIFTYSGTDAYHVQRTSEYDWRKTGILYWQGAPVNRHAPEYADLVDELYISAIQNPLYRQALKNVNKYILHSIGNPDENETVFTRKEFETQINALSAFIKQIS